MGIRSNPTDKKLKKALQKRRRRKSKMIEEDVISEESIVENMKKSVS